jgi:hypothetical protein
MDAAIAFDRKVSVRATELSVLAKADPVGGIIPASPEIRRDYEAVLSLMRDLKEADLNSKVIATKLKNMTGNTGGIEGITKRSVSDDVRYLDYASLEEAQAEIYQRYKNRETVRPSFKLIGMPADSCFPGIKLALDTLQAETPILLDKELDVSVILPQTDEALELHDSYLGIRERIAGVKSELQPLNMDLRLACGTNQGVEGICYYAQTAARSPTFDRKGFKKDHPQLFDQYSTETKAIPITKVFPFRGYL